MSFVFSRAAVLIFACASPALAAVPTPLEFNRDIRPILSENCFYCHGQDPKHREAKLRLDEPAEATRDLGGYAAIVPGKPAASELLLRLRSHDKDEMMPPPKANRHVSPEQVAVLERWISEGAPYQKHWAYLPPQKSALPAMEKTQWAIHPLDRFVLARLEREGLSPSPEAQPETWLRRASFDLTGLPPAPRDYDAFLADVAARGPAAYADAADRLLASPHFGERLATDWLDMARYADTHGFNNDAQRDMWRWRDWVIEAFNANLPYDRFITEQLAGDLLSKPTLEQRIATGFSRNHGINSEGGIINEEYRVEYVADRVRTASTAWLGLTMECARCHDHKFDPITQRDYYAFFAFFNNVPEHGEDGRSGNVVPMIPAPTREQQATLAQQERELAALDLELWLLPIPRGVPADGAHIEELVSQAWSATSAKGQRLIEKESGPEGVVGPAWRAEPEKPAPKSIQPKTEFTAKDGFSLAFWLEPQADNPADVPLLSALDYNGSPDDAGYGRGRELRLIDGELELRISERFPVYAVIIRTAGAKIQPGEWRHVALTCRNGRKAADFRFFVDGTEVPVQVRYNGLFNAPGTRAFLLGADNSKNGARWHGALDEARSFPDALSPAAIRALFQAEALPLALRDSPTPRVRQWLSEALQAEDISTRELVAQRAALWEKHLALRRSLPTTMVMEELAPPRPSFVLTRGNYDAPGEAVTPGVPETLIAPWPQGAPRNRLGLAQWLTQPQHPLTARVVVNRFWAQLFGTGLVKTVEDFGSQSEWPSHPEVLDWLARDFVDSGWDVKALFKSLVLSATYRQSSVVTPTLAARDPENRLLARGPRMRLPAEMIRDQALALSGLLTPRIGGPGVYPYQPEKLYEGVVVGAAYPGTSWQLSKGEDLYRRTLYTFWKRTVTHPWLLTFDAPNHEVCTARRSRTSTPLQALLLWNETGYLEAARQLATRMLHEGGTDDAARLNFAFRLATGRAPTAGESRVLGSAWSKFRADFEAHGEDANAFLHVGASPVDPNLPPAELAAATALASMILNLDETLTKN